MSEHEKDFVGPVVTRGEISDAVAEAAEIDNEGRETRLEENAGYVRIEVQGECVIRFDTVSDVLGHRFTMSDLERNMPAFSGLIRVDSEQVRFLAVKK
ncbi:MmoB/DmpM family protein [Zavarzinia aquatilis]|uniref:Monooxygenase n=1 Tax=Zavarzinia aquatilis TaxID=2211142 RepID=A0A317E2A6_9PROT|nr:MmoB/DmpM family protein [Zavarzinia aquatilis]PWR19503.1 monooxygenase [Zavarzinia aquatilis]